MSWVPLATRLGLHIAMGYLVCLVVLGPAPMGRFFYRLTGWTAAGVAVLAGMLALADGWPEATSERIRVLATWGAVLPAPWYVANRPAVRRIGLLLAVASAGLALAANAFGSTGHGVVQLVSDAVGASVAGGACFAMVFGHAYLTVPKLPIEHLGRIHRWVTSSLGVRLSLVVLVLVLSWPLASAEGTAFGAFDWLDLGIRVIVGLVLPLAFAWMVSSSLRWKNTQSATGILYAMTILVWIGEAVGLHLGSKWGIPL